MVGLNDASSLAKSRGCWCTCSFSISVHHSNQEPNPQMKSGPNLSAELLGTAAPAAKNHAAELGPVISRGSYLYAFPKRRCFYALLN